MTIEMTDTQAKLLIRALSVSIVQIKESCPDCNCQAACKWHQKEINELMVVKTAVARVAAASSSLMAATG
jgi:hypothetical protein